MTFAARLTLLVALLLPSRAVLAMAGILCHSGTGALPAAMVEHVSHDHAAHHQAHDAHASHEGMPAGNKSVDSSLGTPLSSCGFCTSACSVPWLPSGTVALHGLDPPGVDAFPACRAGYASAPVGAIDRPPRTV